MNHRPGPTEETHLLKKRMCFSVETPRTGFSTCTTLVKYQTIKTKKSHTKTHTIKKEKKKLEMWSSNQGLGRTESNVLSLSQKTGMQKKFPGGSQCSIPVKKRHAYKRKPKIGDTKNIPGRETPPKMMETRPFP